MNVSKKLVTALAATLVVAGLAGGGIAMATSKAGPNVCRATKDDSLHGRSVCQKGEVPFAIAKGAKGDPGARGPAGPAGKDGDNALVIRHARITVTADYCAGTTAERTVTLAGLPGFVQSGALEIASNNGADVPDAFLANIAVNAQGTAAGQTTRRYVVTCNGFDHSESYPLDVWILATVG